MHDIVLLTTGYLIAIIVDQLARQVWSLTYDTGKGAVRSYW